MLTEDSWLKHLGEVGGSLLLCCQYQFEEMYRLMTFLDIFGFTSFMVVFTTNQEA